MKIRCCWEHNGSDTLLYVMDYPGAFTRGPSKEAALAKMPGEIATYLAWRDEPAQGEMVLEIAQEKESRLKIADADSDVLFAGEEAPLSREEYEALKALALKSAADFLALYQAIPDKTVSALPIRETFYGQTPRTAEEMYQHTKNVNAYYFGEIGVAADNDGTIYDCRKRGFEALEQSGEFLSRPAVVGSYGELWSLAKMLRRFLWHDRIHAKAMCRMAAKTFGAYPNPFRFRSIL